MWLQRLPPPPEAKAWCVIAEGIRAGRPPLRAVTYDFWNTLIGEHQAPGDQRVDRVMAALTAVDAEVARDALVAASAAAESFYETRWQDNHPFSPEEWAAQVLGELSIDDPAAHDAVAAELRRGLPAAERDLAPGIGDTLEVFRSAGVRVGIVCDVGITPSVVLRSYLRHFGALEYFDHWSFSDDVGVYKPDPVIFNHALAGLGASAEEAAHVGDLRRTDVAGALGMGITSVRYRHWRDDTTDRPEAEVVLSDHRELPALLGVG
ncbi:MAG: HAD family hydrolase [Microthrixaceae bacterium]